MTEKKDMKKIISILLVSILLLTCFAGCSSKAPDKETENGSPVEVGENQKVKMTMENGDSFVIELYPQYAPETVENFVTLVKDGFYNGTTFHRVVDDFMAQGGSPKGNPNGGSKKTIKGEFSSNGFTQNTLSHTRGIISMARSNDPDSASSQFFICYDDVSDILDGNYAAFGQVIEGMDVIDGFTKLDRDYNSLGEKATPKKPLIISTAELI